MTDSSNGRWMLIGLGRTGGRPILPCGDRWSKGGQGKHEKAYEERERKYKERETSGWHKQKKCIYHERKDKNITLITRHNHRASALISVVRTTILIPNGGGRERERATRETARDRRKVLRENNAPFAVEHTRRACGLLIYINDTFHATLCYSPPGMCYSPGARTCKIAPILSSQFVSRNVFTVSILCSFKRNGPCIDFTQGV